MSYHVFVLSVGQNGVERIYIADTGQSREDAEKTLKRTQRKRVIGYRLARPTSHYAAEIAARETRPVGAEPQDGKKRRVVYRSKK
jgi:hypothetical protein